jgi:hypothetical protein
VRQHACVNAPRPAPRSRFALRLVVVVCARCVGPTSAVSRLRTSTRASSVPGRSRAELVRTGVSAVFTSARCASAGPTLLVGVSRRGAFSSLRRACEPASGTPVASLTWCMLARAGMRRRESRRGRHSRARVNGARGKDGPGCLPFSKDPCPAAFSRTPGSGLPRGRDLAAAPSLVDAFSPSPVLSGWHGPGPRPRAPCQRGSRLSEPRRRLPISATASMRGHTRRAFDPRTRAGLSLRFSPAPTDAGCVGLRLRCRMRSPRATVHRATAFARRAPLAWMVRIVGWNTGVKARRARCSERRRACPTRPCSTHPGRRCDSSPGLENVAMHRSDRDPAGAPPRERRRRRGIEVRSASTKLLRDRRMTPPCAPEPRAPSRCLRRGVAQEHARLSSPPLRPPAPDDASDGGGSTRRERRAKALR